MGRDGSTTTSISAPDDDDFLPNGVRAASRVGGHWQWNSRDMGEGTMPGAAMANPWGKRSNPSGVRAVSG